MTSLAYLTLCRCKPNTSKKQIFRKSERHTTYRERKRERARQADKEREKEIHIERKRERKSNTKRKRL